MISLDLLRGGVNDAGQIAFWAALANGRKVIVRADPIADTGTGQPDLVVTLLTAPTEGVAGRLIDVRGHRGQCGHQEVSAFATWLLPLDRSCDPPRRPVDRRALRRVPPLSPGATVHCRGGLLLPLVPAGTYHLGAIVDDVGAIAESDETNNMRSADGGPIAIDVRCAAISAPSRLFAETVERGRWP